MRKESLKSKGRDVDVNAFLLNEMNSQTTVQMNRLCFRKRVSFLGLYDYPNHIYQRYQNILKKKTHLNG